MRIGEHPSTVGCAAEAANCGYDAVAIVLDWLFFIVVVVSMRSFKIALLLALLFNSAPLLAGPQWHAPASPPKLVVVLVVDQMRADYVGKYGHQWSAGLRRLVDEGAWFREARYPYWRTVTCAGHATISTGSFPSAHGMVGNTWYEQAEGKHVTCTQDVSVSTISYGQPSSGGDSAHRLMRPTLSDEIRRAFGEQARIVAFSRKARAAISLGGHHPDAVAWLDSRGNWVTSTAFAKEPVPFLLDFIRAHPVEADSGKTWERTLPASRYLNEDNGLGEKAPAPWDAEFPHQLPSTKGVPDEAYASLWINSPFADDYLGAMAMAAVDALKMGRGPATDFLGVGFSGLDAVGHDFGPRSHEVQDVLVRLDRTLGRLFAHLDATVGRGNYAVALSADHGVSPIIKQAQAEGLNAGYQPRGEMRDQIEAVLQKHFGAGQHVARVRGDEVMFAPGVYEKLRQQKAVLDELVQAIQRAPGVARVLTRDDLREGVRSRDSVIRAYALSAYPGRGYDPDLYLVTRPYWLFTNAPRDHEPAEVATHGSGHDYDQRVPVILMGRMFRPGRYASAATPADIAPTLASVVGIEMKQVDGRVLSEALRGKAPTKPATLDPPPKK